VAAPFHADGCIVKVSRAAEPTNASQFIGVKKVIVRIVLILFALCATSHAQKLVDPSKVAPEYREAAEKRRAEQIRQQACAKKADSQKVLPRDRIIFLNRCLEEEAAKQ
jgi:hypothetical protein